jgi:teichuronic acid biosynthesis glycosyltransferase TuaC
VRTLVVTNIFPTSSRPDLGTFVARQVESLRAMHVEIEVVHLDRAQRGRRAYRDLSETIQRSLAASNPDLVHVMYGGVMADRVTHAVRDRPVLVSFCGTDLLGGGAQTVVDRLSWTYSVLASRRAASRAAGIVVKSQNLKEALPRRVDERRTWILPNGIDLARFTPRDEWECREELGWDSRSKHVLFPASADRAEKRFDLAWAAVDLVKARHRDVELHALSGVRHEDVPVWLNAADVVLLTSDHEGSPNAIKEALACNVPVVSVDVGDVRERIETIYGCFLAEDRSPRTIATALSSALEMRDRIDGRATVMDLSLDRVAARLCDIYGVVASNALRTAAG